MKGRSLSSAIYFSQNFSYAVYFSLGRYWGSVIGDNNFMINRSDVKASAREKGPSLTKYSVNQP